jgi:hypothetical protein
MLKQELERNLLLDGYDPVHLITTIRVHIPDIHVCCDTIPDTMSNSL